MDAGRVGEVAVHRLLRVRGREDVDNVPRRGEKAAKPVDHHGHAVDPRPIGVRRQHFLHASCPASPRLQAMAFLGPNGAPPAPVFRSVR